MERIEEINGCLSELSALLAARSRELDRRRAFDEEISEQIKELMNGRSEEEDRQRQPDDKGAV